MKPDNLSVLSEFLHKRENIDPARVTPEALLEELKVDSLLLLELLFEFEDRLGVKIPQDIPRPKTVGDFLGLVNPFGGDLADFFSRMLSGESAIRLYTREDKVTRALSVPAVRCADFDADSALGRSLAYTMDRYSQLGTTAALSAWRDAGLPRTKDAPRN